MEVYKNYNEERYAKLKIGDTININVAHFMNWTSVNKAKHCSCKFGDDYEYNKNTDCCYVTHELHNDKDEFVCASAIEYPECCLSIVEIDDDKVVLIRADEENNARVTLTKEELLVAATRYDGFDWQITF